MNLVRTKGQSLERLSEILFEANMSHRSTSQPMC